MSISEIVKSKGIDELLHFTMNRGFVGILHLQQLLPRHRLESRVSDGQAIVKEIDEILELNSPVRRDLEYTDYVNLSISEINSRFFGFSSGKWHAGRDVTWFILSFSPEILSHDGVIFVTTNNMYSDAMRQSGPSGLRALFAEQVMSAGVPKRRMAEMPENYPTCGQAEVLYPGPLSTCYLQRVYVHSEDDAEHAEGQLSVLAHNSVEVVTAPEKFRGR